MTYFDKKQVADALTQLLTERRVCIDCRMSECTTFRVGGPADILVEPEDQQQLASVLRLLNERQVPFMVMGNGSNLIVRDGGIRGVVVRLFDRFNGIGVDGDIIHAQAGALLSKIASVALANGLTGFEFAAGIPGTLGGAVVMNAGAYGGEMKDVVVSSTYIDSSSGQCITIDNAAHDFGYRHSALQHCGAVVVSSDIRLKRGDPATIRARMDELAEQRRTKQPLALPSAGSIFRRPEGYFAGKLVEDCGLRGYRMGGAEVSALHCGFIVNAGGATAKDVIRLIEHVQKTVFERFGVQLQTEVKITGEEE